jgi:UDP-glucose 4-epimerase
MSGMTVLVTGVTRFLGSSLAGRLAAHPAVDRVIGVDASLPDPAARARMAGSEFARADIRNPLIARVIEAAGVDTVVHASASAAPVASAARTMAKEMNVLGTMQLLAACQRSGTVANVVVRSTSAVYGASSKDPAIFTEETSPRAVPSSGPARDAVDIEGYVRGFGRRRPDVRIAVPRFAEIIGPTVRTPLTRYFSLSPVVPVPLGHDSRLQFVHEQDAVDLLEHLALGSFAGIVNVAGDGVLTLDQAIHRAGRIPWPVPIAAMDGVSRLMKLARISGFSTQQVKLLTAGRVLDTTRLSREAGFSCRYSTAGAFADFTRTISPTVSRHLVRTAELKVAGALGVRALAEEPVMAMERATPDAPGGDGTSGVSTASGPRLVGLNGSRTGRRHR